MKAENAKNKSEGIQSEEIKGTNSVTPMSETEKTLKMTERNLIKSSHYDTRVK